jgi:hypothetical protein
MRRRVPGRVSVTTTSRLMLLGNEWEGICMEGFRKPAKQLRIAHIRSPDSNPVQVYSVTPIRLCLLGGEAIHSVRSDAGVVGSNPTRGIDVCVFVLYVGSGLATGLSPI